MDWLLQQQRSPPFLGVTRVIHACLRWMWRLCCMLPSVMCRVDVFIQLTIKRVCVFKYEVTFQLLPSKRIAAVDC